MTPSPLQLEHSTLGKITLVPTSGPEWSDGITVEANPVFARNDRDPALWQVMLLVRFSGGDGKPAPYEGHIEVVGFFRVLAKDLPEEKQRLLVAVNATAILYATAREIIASLTARSTNGLFLLPSVSFVDTRISMPEERPAKTGRPRAAAVAK